MTDRERLVDKVTGDNEERNNTNSDLNRTSDGDTESDLHLSLGSHEDTRDVLRAISVSSQSRRRK